jgi:phosphoglycolate phosphatase-like HAD superfamily hydrolase
MLRAAMRLVPGVIIDVDGTLVDSNGARAQAWVEALNSHGHPARYEELKKLAGIVPNEILVRFTGLGLDTRAGQAIHDRYLHVFRTRLLPRIIPFYRAPLLVERIRECGLRLAVASADPPDTLLPLLRIAGAEFLFHRSGAQNAAHAAASNREVIKAALDRLGSASPHVLMLADAPFDIEAASQLNVPVIAFETGGWTEGELAGAGAAAVYADANHLLHELAQSPIASLIVASQSAQAG